MLMGIKRILLGVTGTHFDDVCCSYAFSLASRYGAAVDVRLIRPMADDPAVLMASGFTGSAFRHFIESIDHTVTELDRMARDVVAVHAARYPDVVYDYHNPAYNDLDSLASEGIASDLIVLAHPALIKLHYYREAVEHAIVNSGRPVLLMTKSATDALFRHVVFVWRNDAITALSMMMCLPLLSMAESITLATVVDDLHAESRMPDKGVAYFAQHGLHVSQVSLPREGKRDHQVIDDYCDQVEASLVVSGVVVHSDNREFFFSSTASRMLASARHPLLLIG
jgi:nucleotide-binding universal stress UspA family protein